MLPDADYVEYAPAAPLRPYVACYWTRRAPAAGEPGAQGHRVLPDGCIDILLELDGPAFGEPSALDVVGTMTRAIVVPPRGGGVAFVGVRFRPGGAQPFLRVPAAELTDQRVQLQDLWGDAAALAERVATAGGGALARVRAVEAALLERLTSGAAPRPAPDVGAAVGLIERSGGTMAVEALSDTLGVTRQHLARQFSKHVGVSPKTLCRVVRVRGVVARAGRDAARAEWSALAYELGYYDQSHLIAEFKELTGLTPEEWRERPVP